MDRFCPCFDLFPVVLGVQTYFWPKNTDGIYNLTNKKSKVEKHQKKFLNMA
jgi:hypothetical protein